MRLTERAHHIVREHVRPGDITIDATVGNGHDTRFLADLVGDHGRVYGFDVQPEAITRTGERVGPNVTLFLADHASMAEVLSDVRGQVAAAMFNLGYLPNSDKTITTNPGSTVRAGAGALSLLRPGGVLTILAYRGHPGGAEEADAVRSFVRGLPTSHRAEEWPASDGGDSPVLFVVRTAEPG